jgi:hypothetical protein
MRRSIATVSLSGTLPEKLEAIAVAKFDGVEIFENDLVFSALSPGEVRAICDDLGLTIDLFQPFRDFEGVDDAQLLRNLDRAQRKFDLMAELGAPMMLVCAGKKQPGTLALGVLLSSIVWDALYLSLGAFFGTTLEIGQGYMLLISLGCISVIYLAVYAIRKLISRFRKPVEAVPYPEATQTESLPIPVKEERSLQPARKPVNRVFALALRMSTTLVILPAVIFNCLGKVFR